MKQLYIFILLISTLSCSSNESRKIKDRINESAYKIKVFDVNADQIYEQNSRLIKQNKLQGAEITLSFFKQFDDSLQRMRDECIAAAGGYTIDGLYFNVPAYEGVNDYFYGKSKHRNNSIIFFYNTLDTLKENLKQLAPNSQLSKNIDVRFNILLKYYGLKNRKDLFKNLSINEAVELIEAFRRQVALGQYEYLLNKYNS